MPKPNVVVMDDAYWDSIPEVLRPADLARITRKKIETVWTWLAAGRLPGHKIGHVWVIYRDPVRFALENPKKPHQLPQALLDRFPNEELSVDDLAVLVGKTRQTTYAWLASGDLPGHQIGRSWLIYKSEFVQTLERTANPSSPDN